MKLDYELIQSILEKIESESDGFSRCSIPKSEYSDSDEHFKKFLKLSYHYKILIENGFVDGKVLESSSFGGNYPVSISFSGLTLAGHKLLESMQNETLWNKVKENLQGVGVEGLKQIPSLAIQLLSSGA